MNLKGKKVAILVDNYFEQSEFEKPLKALKDGGAKVIVIASSQKQLQALNHVKPGDSFKTDLLLSKAKVDDYDALVLPGGAINADHLRVNKTAQKWVTKFLDNGKALAVICHAPWLLVSADIIEGRRLTSYYTIADDVRNAGGEWVDLPVVIDRNLITSRGPDDLPFFNKALLHMLSYGSSLDEAAVNSQAK